MAEFKATKSQQQAIDSSGSAVLVSAGAGSGKTRVITERLMSRICHDTHPVDVDSFLIITYTRAAAAELRGRIMDELSRRMSEQPENRRLRRQLALCSRAQIGTIHSFCATVLRENCHRIGLTPDFKIVDDERAANMKNTALERVLEERYSNADSYPGFLSLADTVGAGRDDSRLTKLVLGLHSKMQCHARPHQWAARQIEQLQTQHSDIGESPWGQEILSQIADQASYWSGELDRLMEDMAAEEKIAKAYLPSISETAEQLRCLLRCTKTGWDAARSCLPILYPRLGVLRSSPDPQLSERIKQRRKDCKAATEDMEKKLNADSQTLLAQLRSTAPVMEALLSLTLAFDQAYRRDKRRSGLVDYSDLEHLTAELLTEEDGSPTELAKRLSLRYTEIMVDEYQDVSRVQDTVFSAISREGKNLFFVGDVKQSIYRFRLADPGIFTEKYLSYADADKAGAGEPRRIMLQENFRSRREILDCANTVFGLCMSRRLGELDYDEDAALKNGASYEDSVPVPELMLLELKSESEDDSTPRPDKVALEATMVGRKILSLMDSDIRVQGRPLAFDDICLLMRSANTTTPIYRQVLSAMGIPVAAVQSGDFFSSIEISVMLSMLAVIDNPHQDIPLIAVLRAAPFGFTADELSEIRAEDRKCDFYTALCRAADKNEKCASFIARLEKLRRLAPDLSASDLLWQLIDELDMLSLCSAMSDGAVRRNRLMELLALSHHFETTGYRGLHRFVLWLRQLSEKEQQPGGAVAEKGVKIMTVHKSKGLEFPVVFLCDTGRRFNKQDSMESVLVHPVLGLGPKVTDLKKRIEYPSLARNAIHMRLERESLSEEMRLLYVALTRAKERLFITAGVRGVEALIEKSSAALSVPLPPQILATAGSPVHWLIYTALADDGQHLKMNVYEASDTFLPEHTEAAAAEAESLPSVSPEALQDKLGYRYPHSAAEHLPSKLTATELKGRRERDEDAQSTTPIRRRSFRMPQLGETASHVSAAQRGIATHLALQYMDFSHTEDLAQIQQEISTLREKQFLTPQDAALVDANAIYRLFSSPLGERMRRAERVHREFKFSILVDASDFFPDATGEKLLLQGVVDCCLEESGKLVIIDYKTDRLHTGQQLQERAAQYAPQLGIYSLALSRIFGLEVSACLLYFLSAGKIVEISEKDLQSK